MGDFPGGRSALTQAGPAAATSGSPTLPAPRPPPPTPGSSWAEEVAHMSHASAQTSWMDIRVPRVLRASHCTGMGTGAPGTQGTRRRLAEREGAWNTGHRTSGSVCFPAAHPEQEGPYSCSWGARRGMQWGPPLSLLDTKQSGCLVKHRDQWGLQAVWTSGHSPSPDP